MQYFLAHLSYTKKCLIMKISLPCLSRGRSSPGGLGEGQGSLSASDKTQMCHKFLTTCYRSKMELNLGFLQMFHVAHFLLDSVAVLGVLLKHR